MAQLQQVVCEIATNFVGAVPAARCLQARGVGVRMVQNRLRRRSFPGHGLPDVVEIWLSSP
jgi:hypothetical protein